MPQLNQLADVAYSQFFWLLLVLGIIYFGIGKAMLPKIRSTVQAREQRIAGDLAAAQAARTAAEETEAAYRAKMDAARAEVLKLVQQAKQAGAKTTEERIQAANAANASQIEAAETRIRTAAATAVAEIEGFAAEAAQEMVQRIAGLSVSKSEAAQAVKAAMTHG